MSKKIALVTGSNKGIGLEICRQLAKNDIKVIMTSRDTNKGESALKELKESGFDVVYHQLDVSDEKSINNLAEFVKSEFGKLDILVNNAGIFLDSSGFIDTDISKLKQTMDTNFYGAFLLSQKLIPLMSESNYGRVVNVSSGMGQINDMGMGSFAYRISKLSLNGFTKMMANELKGNNILVNSMCPGWVKTDMGGSSATRSVEQGADTAVWLSLLPDNGPTGKFFRDRNEIPW